MIRVFSTAPAPHLAVTPSVRRSMAWVLLALLPGTVLQAWSFGPGVLWQLVISIGFALAFEAAMLRLRARPLRPFLGDLSAPVAAALFALCLPPLAPWWIAATGMATAMVIAKHLYGGLGFNLFNPAMVGYAVVLVCFPLELTRWTAPAGVTLDALEAARTILSGELPHGFPADAIVRTVPLDALGDAQPDRWRWIVVGHALGGVLLLWRGVIRWQVPLAVLGTVCLLSLPFWLHRPELHPSPLQQLATGSLVFAAFFIATDPVTGCSTPRGRLWFGVGVALLVLAIRRWGAHPDGIAFAVLLMNGAAPWIDLHTRPRIHGEGRAA